MSDGFANPHQQRSLISRRHHSNQLPVRSLRLWAFLADLTRRLISETDSRATEQRHDLPI